VQFFSPLELTDGSTRSTHLNFRRRTIITVLETFLITCYINVETRKKFKNKKACQIRIEKKNVFEVFLYRYLAQNRHEFGTRFGSRRADHFLVFLQSVLRKLIGTAKNQVIPNFIFYATYNYYYYC